MKEDLRQIWSQPDKDKASEIIDDWLKLAKESKYKILMTIQYQAVRLKVLTIK
jgi:hypothetical protein